MGSLNYRHRAVNAGGPHRTHKTKGDLLGNPPIFVFRENCMGCGNLFLEGTLREGGYCGRCRKKREKEVQK